MWSKDGINLCHLMGPLKWIQPESPSTSCLAQICGLEHRRLHVALRPIVRSQRSATGWEVCYFVGASNFRRNMTISCSPFAEMCMFQASRGPNKFQLAQRVISLGTASFFGYFLWARAVLEQILIRKSSSGWRRRRRFDCPKKCDPSRWVVCSHRMEAASVKAWQHQFFCLVVYVLNIFNYCPSQKTGTIYRCDIQ